MGLTFNSLLDDYGIDPRDVRLLRHQTIKYAGKTPYRGRLQEGAKSYAKVLASGIRR